MAAKKKTAKISVKPKKSNRHAITPSVAEKLINEILSSYEAVMDCGDDADFFRYVTEELEKVLGKDCEKVRVTIDTGEDRS